MELPKQSTYTEAVKRAILKHSASHIPEYNEFSRAYYHKKKEDAEWKEQFNAKCREANKKYRDKKRVELGEGVRPKGRPRKIAPDTILL